MATLTITICLPGFSPVLIYLWFICELNGTNSNVLSVDSIILFFYNTQNAHKRLDWRWGANDNGLVYFGNIEQQVKNSSLSHNKWQFVSMNLFPSKHSWESFFNHPVISKYGHFDRLYCWSCSWLRIYSVYLRAFATLVCHLFCVRPKYNTVAPKKQSNTGDACHVSTRNQIECSNDSLMIYRWHYTTY